MREIIIVAAFLPFLYYATLDGIFHFRGRRVSLAEHVIHVAIGLSLALVFAAAVMANQLVMLGSLVAFLVSGGLDEFVWHRDFRSLGIVGMPGNLASHGAMSRDGDLITLTIDEGHARLLNSRHEEKILAALRNRFGDSIQLRTEHGNPGPHTPAAYEERQRKARQEAAEASIRRDPVVKSIVERFEARVVEDSIRPAETSRR